MPITIKKDTLKFLQEVKWSKSHGIWAWMSAYFKQDSWSKSKFKHSRSYRISALKKACDFYEAYIHAKNDYEYVRNLFKEFKGTEIMTKKDYE